MAEINVQHKRANTWVWWVVAIVALAMLTWWLFARDTTRMGMGEVTEPVPTAPVDTVAPFGAPADRTQPDVYTPGTTPGTAPATTPGTTPGTTTPTTPGTTPGAPATPNYL